MATSYYFTVADKNIEVHQGQHECPHVTLTMQEQDYLDLVNGKLTGYMAFIRGKVKIVGDTKLALKLPSLFTSQKGSPPITTVQQAIDGIPEAFNRDAAKDIQGIFQMHLT